MQLPWHQSWPPRLMPPWMKTAETNCRRWPLTARCDTSRGTSPKRSAKRELPPHMHEAGNSPLPNGLIWAHRGRTSDIQTSRGFVTAPKT